MWYRISGTGSLGKARVDNMHPSPVWLGSGAGEIRRSDFADHSRAGRKQAPWVDELWEAHYFTRPRLLRDGNSGSESVARVSL